MDWREEKLYGKGMPKGIMRGKIMCRISIVGSLVQVQNVDRFYVNWSRIVGRSSLAIMFCYCFKVIVMVLMDALNPIFLYRM